MSAEPMPVSTALESVDKLADQCARYERALREIQRLSTNQRYSGLIQMIGIRDVARRALREPPNRESESDEKQHPESVCGRCGGTNPVWSAPSPLWNQVMRGGSINGGPEPYAGIVCPSCFATLATEAGIASGWRLMASDVRVELEEVTPSGRVWNPKTWLWDEAVANQGSEPSHHERPDPSIASDVMFGTRPARRDTSNRERDSDD